jgi:hypothetical protein
MRANQLVVLGLVLLAASGQACQARVRGITAIPSYANWTQAAENVPCDKVEKVGHEVKVIGPLIVDGKSYEQHVIKDENLIKIVDERCHLRLE